MTEFVGQMLWVLLILCVACLVAWGASLCTEAATELKRLKADNERLIAVLTWVSEECDDNGMAATARAALEEP
ncbi:MAG: hypothetical protein Q8N51_00605 [Gammaproteobacteria bacterium]|nr:hypothetical protein [Gammaproteobacteria bacterium]